jgi:hypothetical protein
MKHGGIELQRCDFFLSVVEVGPFVEKLPKNSIPAKRKYV